MTNERLLFDIEADGYNELVIDKKGKIVREAKVVHVMWVMNLDTQEMTLYKGDSLREGVMRLWAAAEINGHNIIAYDIPILERVTGLKRPANQPVNDTLIRSRLISPDTYDHSLEAWGKRLNCFKGDFKGPWDVWSQVMEDYCKQDVVVNFKIIQYLAKTKQNEMVVRIEHEVCKILARQTDNGWGFDKEFAEKLIAELEIERAGIMDELQRAFPPRIEVMKTPAYYEIKSKTGKVIGKADTKGAAEKLLKGILAKAGVKRAQFTGTIEPGPMRTKEHPFNPDSGDQIADRLIEKYKWVPVEMTESEDNPKPKTDYDVLVKLPYPEVKLLLSYSDNVMVLDQAIDRLKRAGVSRDGRVHGSINGQGCVTGRMSHKQPNDGQVKKCEHGKPSAPGLVPGPDPNHCNCAGVKMRRLYKPRPGRKLVGADASGLELRMLANRMAVYDGGAYGKILLEGDIHSTNQTAAGLATRDNAKTFIYAFLYGAGDEKIGKVIGKGATEGKKLRARFLAGLPALAKLIDRCKSAAKDEGWLTLLDGRQVPCRSQHSALNTQLQGDGAIVMKVALLILDKALQARGFKPGITPDTDYEFCGNIHDEWQIECRPEIADEIGKMAVAAIAEAGKRLKCKIALAGEYKVGNNWAETH
jgi:DNA polymerase I-like protein with 3'-5' exonuclease and polymerase domains